MEVVTVEEEVILVVVMVVLVMKIMVMVMKVVVVIVVLVMKIIVVVVMKVVVVLVIYIVAVVIVMIVVLKEVNKLMIKVMKVVVNPSLTPTRTPPSYLFRRPYAPLSPPPSPSHQTMTPLNQVAAQGRLMLFALMLLLAAGTTRGDSEVTEAPSPAVSVGPYFLSPGSRNITATVGQTAYLPCRVAELADQVQQVSWIRKRDLHVMSSGVVVFASDQRFQVVHPDKSENWTLQIRFAQVRDSGVYECQVNTEPKMSLAYHLVVVESRASLLGPEYVRAGSTLNLTCIVTPPAAPGLVYWYHNGVMLDYEGPVAILTQEGPEGTRSSLTIGRASPVHSGNYTC